uniref:SUN domain-containing protein n=1 Tax=Myripristis murdjan TaxID=586833 RepID=A0A667WV57_9TELE
MSRRSARLVSGGYYNSDEESDSSSVTNISYRESPVRVFKKKAGGRKAASRTSSRANSNASSVSTELPVTPDQYDGLSPALQSSPTQHSMRTVPYTPTTATPRPALTPTSARSQTPTSCPLAPPEKSSVAGLCGSSRPGCLIRPRHKELNQSGVDSSGYSSSEGHYRKPTAITSAASGISSIHGAPVKGRRGSGSPSQMSSISSVAAAVKSRIMTLADQANASLSSRTKKTAGLLLLVLLIIILCIWLLLPLLTSLFSRMTVTRTPTPTKPKSQPVSPVIPPAHPNTVHPVVDPAVVSAAVEEKMHRLLGELLLKQESLISQMEERLQLDMQGVRTRLEAADSDSRLRLEKEIAGLGRQMADYQRDSRSAATNLDLRIQAVEAQNAKLSRELSSVQMRPPPAPCPNPDPVTAPVHNLLTPELQQAMEKWLSDRIKQQDAIRLSGKESCSDCGRPMADKMADFALETQGASVVSTRCSETYRIRSACVTLFGFPLWYPSESPRTVIQGYPVLLPGKCWAFHGVQGTLLISLSHPIRVTHVTLDHLPRYNSPTGRIDSAPKDFEVYVSCPSSLIY